MIDYNKNCKEELRLFWLRVRESINMIQYPEVAMGIEQDVTPAFFNSIAKERYFDTSDEINMDLKIDRWNINN